MYAYKGVNLTYTDFADFCDMAYEACRLSEDHEYWANVIDFLKEVYDMDEETLVERGHNIYYDCGVDDAYVEYENKDVSYAIYMNSPGDVDADEELAIEVEFQDDAHDSGMHYRGFYVVEI